MYWVLKQYTPKREQTYISRIRINTFQTCSVLSSKYWILYFKVTTKPPFQAAFLYHTHLEWSEPFAVRDNRLSWRRGWDSNPRFP